MKRTFCDACGIEVTSNVRDVQIITKPTSTPYNLHELELCLKCQGELIALVQKWELDHEKLVS